MAGEREGLLAEQVAYYRTLAPEYEANSPWPHEEVLRATLSATRAAFQPRGDVLELACGTGVCAETLAAHASRLDAVRSVVSSRMADPTPRPAEGAG